MSYSSNNNNRLPSNLAQLQNLIKRDPDSYVEEFERQYALYSATKAIFEQSPTVYNEQFHELILFLSQVAQCYSKYLGSFPENIVNLLRKHGSILHPDMRMAFVRALVLLRNKNLLVPTDLLILFFQLLRCQDKSLRKFLEIHIVSDIKNINARTKNTKLNKELQNFMFEMLKDSHPIAIKTSLDVMIDLYNKKVWNDAKTVNIIAEACFSKITKIMVTALNFFVGKDEDADEEDSHSESENNAPNVNAALMAVRVNKKNKKKTQKKVDKMKAALKKNQKKKTTKVSYDFSAIHLIHDPQKLAEGLYKRLTKMHERFEVRLMNMNFISRLIGIHQLYLPNFYPFIQKYLFPHQQDVTKIMVYAAQSAHPLVPPDDLEPVLKTLANNFVTERCSSDAIAIGLNTIREMCSRNPFCMSADLLQDFSQYKNNKNKSISMAARSLITLFREKNPQLLAKKDRGAPSELKAECKTQQFGESDAKSYIPGAEILSFEIAEQNGNENMSDSDWESDLPSESENNEESVNLTKKCNRFGIKNNSVLSKKEAVSAIMKLAPEERASRSSEILTTRILSDADFAKIEAAQAAKQIQRFSSSKKRKYDTEEYTNVADSEEVVKLKNIEMIYKKRKHDKEARMESLRAGREGKTKHGGPHGRINPHASTTNREKQKGKHFMMVKHKFKKKQLSSFKDKQIRLRNSLLKQQRTIIK